MYISYTAHRVLPDYTSHITYGSTLHIVGLVCKRYRTIHYVWLYISYTPRCVVPDYTSHIIFFLSKKRKNVYFLYSASCITWLYITHYIWQYITYCRARLQEIPNHILCNSTPTRTTSVIRHNADYSFVRDTAPYIMQEYTNQKNFCHKA